MRLKAYTLLEMIVVMGIISVVGMFLIPYTVNELKYNSSRNTASDLASLIYSYQQAAYSGKDNTAYGFSFSSNSYTLFVGNSLSTATASDVNNFAGHIYISYLNVVNGGNELVFAKGSIKPSSATTIQITDEFASYGININQEGFISIYKV